MLIPVSRISSSAGLAWAYGMLTAAFVAAWFTVSTTPPTGTWRSVVVVLSALIGALLAVWLSLIHISEPTRPY